ncbi:MAG TPA: tyrosinase family protein [Gammaproteobacteria bacterium]
MNTCSTRFTYVKSHALLLLTVFPLILSGCGEGNVREESVGAKASVARQVGAASVPVRQNITDFVKNPKLVNDFRNATEIMRKNGTAKPSTPEFRTSLVFWANTHGFFGTGKNATNYDAIVKYRGPQCLDFFTSEPYSYSKSDAQAVCESYFTASSQPFTPDQYSEGIWGTCQHTNATTRATPRFLPWHRLYLYYYERTLRKHSGNADFALPYWNYFDYTATVPKGNLYLPPLVTDGGSIANNTFFDQLRTEWLNERKVSMTPDNADATDAFAAPSFVDFSNTLEGVPHGAMHCATGNGCTTPHIGWVPVAGNDPAFYMHHANIDRLWQCWMVREANGARIDLAWAKANLGMPESWYQIKFDFADENGNRVSKTIADAFSPEVLAVHYDEEVDCQIAPRKSMKNLLLADIETVHTELQGTEQVLAAGKTELAARPKTVELSAQPKLREANGVTANKLLESMGPVSPGVWLVLENITVKQAPAHTYNVYISHKNRPGKRALVTRFNFFGFGEHAHHGEAGSMGTQRYYLNDDISELGIRDARDIVVQFEPSNAVTGEVLNTDQESLISIDSIRLISR